jgi:DNA-binding transcriptional regulator GbsR (MarR family)
MNERQAAFVEEMGQYLGSVGMTPMAGRMLAWLLICDPAEQTAADLTESLRASRGAISGSARALETAGFIRRPGVAATAASISASRRAGCAPSWPAPARSTTGSR